MAFDDSLAISSVTPTAGSGSDVTFTTIERGLKETTRMNTATDLSSPENLVIRHQVQGSTKNGGTITDRHLIQAARTELDGDGNPYTCVVNLTIAVPRVGLFSQAEVQRQIDLIVNLLLASGAVAAILRGES